MLKLSASRVRMRMFGLAGAGGGGIGLVQSGIEGIHSASRSTSTTNGAHKSSEVPPKLAVKRKDSIPCDVVRGQRSRNSLIGIR